MHALIEVTICDLKERVIGSYGGSVYILSDLHFDDEDCKLMNPDWITPGKQLSVIMMQKAYITITLMKFIQDRFLWQRKYYCHMSRCMDCHGA